MKLSFVTVSTNDLEGSIKFYTDLFGFKLERQYKPTEGVEIAFISDEHYTLEFICSDNYPAYNGGGISLGFTVDDIEETMSFLKENNIEILDGPIKVPNGVELCHAKDINGLTLGFVSFPK